LKILIYGRPDCHLCDVARLQVDALVKGVEGVEVESLDIESDDELMLLYLERIPVVIADGETVSELVFDPGPLRARLGIA